MISQIGSDIIRSGATKREILHEIEHALTHKRLGNDAYWKLSESAREHLASTFVRSRDAYKKFTPDEMWEELRRIDPNFVPTGELESLLRSWGALL